MQFTLFDIGANSGADSIDKTRLNPDYITHAFEPTPRLYNHILNTTEDIRSRYFINQVAVSDFNGRATFNVAGQADWGCSSLNNFSDDLSTTWPGRTDFKVTEKIEVNVITLETYIKSLSYKLESIDFLHCDTQGSDLKVLIGLGEYINIVKSGVIEVPNNEQVKLYKENHTLEEAKRFIESKGFEIYQFTRQMNEMNMFFRKVNK